MYAKDWMSGERKWFIDWIAPFGHNMELYKYMRKKYPYELFRAIRLDESSKTGKIAEFHGG
ncbi:hemolysin-activating lysine-acyltransferase hlyC, partial [Escherichia coli TW09195]